MAFDVLREIARMAKPDKDGLCRISCHDCPLGCHNNINCFRFLMRSPEEATEIIRKWSKEHPVKTRAEVFKEHYQSAIPLHICPVFMGVKCPTYGKICDCGDCKRAYWNSPAED